MLNLNIPFRGLVQKYPGSVAKNLAFLQNQWMPSQLGNLINIITDKIAHKGKNCSLKPRKYYFCTKPFMNILTDSRSPWSKEVMVVILVIIRNAQMLNTVTAFTEKR